MRTIEVQNCLLDQIRPHSKGNRQLVLQLPQLIQEVEQQKLIQVQQVLFQSLFHHRFEEASVTLTQKVTSQVADDLRSHSCPANHELQEEFIVSIEDVLQVFEHPPRLLQVSQLGLINEEVGCCLATLLPVFIKDEVVPQTGLLL